MLEQKFEFDEDNEDKVPFEFHYNYFKSRRVAYEKGMEENDWIYDDDDFGENGDEEDDDDDTEWEYWDNSQELKNRYVCIKLLYLVVPLYLFLFFIYIYFLFISS